MSEFFKLCKIINFGNIKKKKSLVIKDNFKRTTPHDPGFLITTKTINYLTIPTLLTNG